MAGTSLFGWCLPGAGMTEHSKCKHSFTFGENNLVCPCPCHSDPKWELKPIVKKGAKHATKNRNR